MRRMIGVGRGSKNSSEGVVEPGRAQVRVETTPGTRDGIIDLVQLYRTNIIDVGSESMVIEITGEEDKINALHNLLSAFGIIEMLRTGLVAMVRGQANGMANGHDGQVNGQS